MQQIKPGTKIDLLDMEMEVVVIEVINENENTVGLVTTDTYALIYHLEDIDSLLEFLPSLGEYKIK